MYAGSLELVDLAVQRHWLPGHGVRLARIQVHHAPQRLPRQETPSCRGRMGHGYHSDPTHLPTFDRPHRTGNPTRKPGALPRARMEDARPRWSVVAQHSRRRVSCERVGRTFPWEERGRVGRDCAKLQV